MNSLPEDIIHIIWKKVFTDTVIDELKRLKNREYNFHLYSNDIGAFDNCKVLYIRDGEIHRYSCDNFTKMIKSEYPLLHEQFFIYCPNGYSNKKKKLIDEDIFKNKIRVLFGGIDSMTLTDVVITTGSMIINENYEVIL